MTIPEEIEQLKAQLDQTTDEHEQAEVLLEILKKYYSIRSTYSQPEIDRLLVLADKFSDPLYKAWGLYYFSGILFFKGDYNLSLDISNQALSIFSKIKEVKGISSCYSRNGAVYLRQGNYPEALTFFSASLKVNEETGDKNGIAQSYSHIGHVDFNQGNYPEALEKFFASLKIKEEIGDKNGIAEVYNNIGAVYEHQGNYHKALKHHLASLHFKEEIGDKSGIVVSYNNIGIIYEKQGNYDEALKNHFASLKLKEEMGDKNGIVTSYNNIGVAYENQGNYPEALKYHIASLKIKKEIGDKSGIVTSYNNIGIVYEKQGDHHTALKYLFDSLQLGEEIGDKDVVKDNARSLSKTYASLSDYVNALEYYEKYCEVEKEIMGVEVQNQLAGINLQHEMEQKEKEAEIHHLRNVELKNAFEHLQKERDRSESLLLNILPSEVAEELKEKGTADAKLFDEVTVLFTDFNDFIKVSERLSPRQLVDELHACFSAFDHIMHRHGIEKIKTVGDSYLAVSGLPRAHERHAEKIIKATMDIRAFMLNRRQELGEMTFEIRIGVHTGSVVAGIVGIKKFAYDIWGDTVNTAARMEQNSEAGKINISGATYDLVKDKFSCEYRGEIEAKNKGKLKMYFVST